MKSYRSQQIKQAKRALDRTRIACGQALDAYDRAREDFDRVANKAYNPLAEPEDWEE